MEPVASVAVLAVQEQESLPGSVENKDEIDNLLQTLKKEEEDNEKKVTRKPHWSVYVEVTLGVLGVITIVAASVFKLFPVIFLGVALCISGILGTIYIRKFNINFDLKEYNREFSAKVRELMQRTLGFKRENSRLEQLNKRNKGLIEELEELVDSTNKKVESKVKKLNKATTKLSETTKKLEETEASYEGFREIITKTTTEMSTFNQQYEAFHKDAEDLSSRVKELSTLDKNLQQYSKSLEGSNKTFSKHNQSLITVAKDLCLKIGALQSIYTKIREEKKALKEEIKELKALNVDTKKTVGGIQKTNLSALDLIKKVNQSNLRFEKIINKSKELLETKERS